MATITVTKNYADGTLLLSQDLTDIADSIETFLNTTKINDDNIQTEGIDASTKFVGSSITNAKMAANSVDTTQIADDAVTGAKLAAAVAGSGLAQDGSGNLDVQVDAATITITSDTLGVPDDGIPLGKQKLRATAASQYSSDADEIAKATISTLGYNYTSVTEVTGSRVAATSTGRPIMIETVPDGTTSPASIGYDTTSSGSATATIWLYRSLTSSYSSETLIGLWQLNHTGSWYFQHTPNMIKQLYTGVAAGSTYYFRLKCSVATSSPTVEFNNLKIIAYEI